jgi:hypothetical protein
LKSVGKLPTDLLREIPSVKRSLISLVYFIRTAILTIFRCISHILNLVVQDILRDYLASEKSDYFLSNYIDSITLSEEIEVEEEFTSKYFSYIYITNLIRSY